MAEVGYCEWVCVIVCYLVHLEGIKAKPIPASSFCISVHDFRVLWAKTKSHRKKYKFPFHREAKYLTAVTGYLGAALGNKAKTTNVLLRETNI